MGFIKAKRAKGVEKPEDKVGGFVARNSDVYDAVIEHAYGTNSEKTDSQCLNLQFKLKNNSKFYARLWFAGADGNVFTTNDQGVKRYRKAFLLADTLINLATEGEEDLFSAETELTTVKMKRDGKDTNVKVPSFPDLIGLPVKLGLIATEKYKQNFVDGEYIDTDEIETISELDQIFDEEGFTLNEIEADAEEPKFIDEWLGAWKDKVRKVKPKAESKGIRKKTSEEGSTAKTRVALRKSRR